MLSRQQIDQYCSMGCIVVEGVIEPAAVARLSAWRREFIFRGEPGMVPETRKASEQRRVFLNLYGFLLRDPKLHRVLNDLSRAIDGADGGVKYLLAAREQHSRRARHDPAFVAPHGHTPAGTSGVAVGVILADCMLAVGPIRFVWPFAEMGPPRSAESGPALVSPRPAGLGRELRLDRCPSAFAPIPATAGSMSFHHWCWAPFSKPDASDPPPLASVAAPGAEKPTMALEAFLEFDRRLGGLGALATPWASQPGPPG